MLSIQIQTQNFTIIKTKNQINNLPSKIRMGTGVVMREREKRTKDLLVREREIEEERSRWLGSASSASSLGWAGLCSSTPAGLCVCACVRECERPCER